MATEGFFNGLLDSAAQIPRALGNGPRIATAC